MKALVFHLDNGSTLVIPEGVPWETIGIVPMHGQTAERRIEGLRRHEEQVLSAERDVCERFTVAFVRRPE